MTSFEYKKQSLLFNKSKSHPSQNKILETNEIIATFLSVAVHAWYQFCSIDSR
jgi:hypothetical protein